VPEVEIHAELRTEFGKGPARRTRAAGRVPGIVYGHGAETKHITLPGHDLMLALKTPNALLRLEGLPGRASLALPKAIQRDPIKGFIEHVDLIAVRRGEKVTVDITVRVSGEVFSGGLLDQQLVQISVEAEATHLPDGVDIDVEGMEIGTAVHAKDIVLPEGTTLATDPEALILHVTAAPTAEQMAGEIGEAAEAEEGEVPARVPSAEGEAAPEAGQGE
jgi:large subunit ribosomal protein L25